MSVQNQSKLPFVYGSVNKFNIPFLLDTGSNVSVISKQVADALKIKILPSPVACLSVTSQPLCIVGQAVVALRIAHFSWMHTVLVCDALSCPAILGADFVIKRKLLMDLANGYICFQFQSEYKIPIVFANNLKFHFFEPPCQIPFESHVSACETLSFTFPHLSSDRALFLRNMISSFSDVLTSELGLTTVLEYEIILKDFKPVRLPPFRLSPPRLAALKSKIQVMLDKGIIQPSCSSYSSPIFLVPKGANDFRPVVDYRVLNTRLSIESIPLPDVHNCFHWFAGAKYFTSLDLNSAYHQIPLAEKSRQYTAFATDWNLYEFTRVPFGIATGAQVLTRLLDIVFGDVKFKYVFNYLDDVVIYSDSFDEHMVHLQDVFSRLRKAGLTVNPDKVSFANSSLNFLGHVISPMGVTIDPERTVKVREFPPPKNVKQLARFIGMVNYFRKFIPNFSKIAEPLNRLRKKDVPFLWSGEQRDAFQQLKLALTSPPVLAVPDFNKRFLLQTDASGTAVAAVLLQEDEHGRRPISYASRVLTAQERKYSVYELEALAILFGMEKFKFYLEHFEFDLETDNKALSWVLGRPRKTGRIARWAVRISAFKFSVRHIQGIHNSIADALSRMYDEPRDPPLPPDNSASAPCPLVSICTILANFPEAFHNLAQYQRDDIDLSTIIQDLRNGQVSPPYELKDDLLCCKERSGQLKIVVPQILVPSIFSYYHSSPASAHCGIFKTRHRIREKFIWKGMDADIRARVRACTVCAMSKPAQKTHYGLLSSGTASTPMEKIFIDYKGPLPRTARGNTYILVCIDAFSKFTWLYPLREATASSTVACLKNLCATFGVPRYIVSDNGRQFMSDVFSKFCFDTAIQHVTTVPHYPNPSHAERVNRNLRSALIAYHSSNHTGWDTNLSWLQFAFNTARHETHGATPFSLVMAYSPNCPLSNLWSLADLLPDQPTPQLIQERWRKAHNNLRRSHQRVANFYNRHRHPVPFKDGDTVMMRHYPVSSGINRFSAKLAPRYIGPFTILTFISPVTVILRGSDGKTKRAHVSQLKPT